jgi:DNA-binding NtrC family response regulator
MASPKVIIVSDRLEARQVFISVLSECGLAPIVASTANEAKAILGCHSISLVFCSDELANGGIEGLKIDDTFCQWDGQPNEIA